MLLTLGLGSMFGTLEGVITPFYDLKIFPWRKEAMTGECIILYEALTSASSCVEDGHLGCPGASTVITSP